MAADTKNIKTKKSGIFSRTARYVWLNFVWSISRTLMLNDIKMKKKSVAELGHNDRLKFTSTLKNIR